MGRLDSQEQERASILPTVTREAAAIGPDRGWRVGRSSTLGGRKRGQPLGTAASAVRRGCGRADRSGAACVHFSRIRFLRVVCGGDSVENMENLESGRFPRGDDASGPNFSGPVWLAQLLDPAQIAANDLSIYNVTFAAGCRNSWHRHSHGQVLLATRSVGYHQIRGQAIQLLRPGDVAVCPPDAEHWHGASPQSEFTHIGISPHESVNEPTWLEPVTDTEYHGPVINSGEQ